MRDPVERVQCPHCGSKPIAAYKELGRYGIEGHLVFKDGCRFCYGKTGILKIFPWFPNEVDFVDSLPYRDGYERF